MRTLLLFFPLILFCDEFFVLPEQNTLFTHHLNRDLLKARNHVYLFSAKLNYYRLQNTLKTLASKQVQLTLITDDIPNRDNRLFQLALLQHVDLYQLKSTYPSKGTLVCIDDRIHYQLSTTLDLDETRTHPAFASVQTLPCADYFHLLLKRSIKTQ